MLIHACRRTQVAAAGMYFAPENQDEEHDTCRCAFCHRSLGGWEAGDDPMYALVSLLMFATLSVD